MSFTLTAGYNWTDGEVVTEAKLDLAALPTLSDGQTYTFGAGTAATPSVNFTGATTTGFYLGSSSIGFAVGGASVGEWSASTFLVNSSAGVYVRKNGSNIGGAVISLSGYDTTTKRDWIIRDDSGVDRLRFARGASDYTFWDVLKVAASDNVSQQSWRATIQHDWTVGSTIISTLNSTGLSIGTGLALQLGNAYVATPQVGTGYVTLKDVNGVTYKVLVST